MQLAHLAAGLDQLDIGVSGDQQMAVKRLHERRAGLALVRPVEQIEQRVVVEFGSALIEQPRHGRRRLRDQPHRPVHHRVLHEPFTRQRRIIPPRPARLALRMQRHEAGRLLAFRQSAAIPRIAGPRPFE
jgi:hypothetical protein